MKKIAVILSGCGHQDGTEITEAVSLLIGLSQHHAEVTCFAPDLNFSPKNHLSGEISKTEHRNILVESARITRGKSYDLKTLNPNEFDAVVVVGGFGAALNLSNWGQLGAQCTVLPELQKNIEAFYSQSKPIGAICIAPAIIAKILGSHKITVTIGTDKETALEIKKTGAIHVDCEVTDYISDRDHKIITTPAYMHKAAPHEVFKGITALAKELVEMA